MRTTLTLDDDLAGLLLERAKQQGITFKAVVNDTIRTGLADTPQARVEAPEVLSHSFGFRPGIDLDRMNQLVDELEVEEQARRHLREAQGQPPPQDES